MTEEKREEYEKRLAESKSPPADAEPSTDSGDVVIEPGTGHVAMSPFGFHRFAGDFLTASSALYPYESGRSPPVKYFLLYKSIELSLKAYLLTRGFTPEPLKYPGKYGNARRGILLPPNPLPV